MKKKLAIMAVSLLSAATMLAFTGCGNDGKSAYDIAVENGFSGTQQEWLESLKGADGANGKDGTDGTDGTDGSNGSAGQAGTNGTKWLSGTVAPDNSVKAANGDYYLNTVSSNLYRNDDGVWVLVTNLNGESAISVWDGTIPGWQNPTLSAEEIVKNRPASYVVNDEAHTIQIYNAEAFAWFAYRSVIGIEGYEGWTVSLKCDIDLNNKLWVPIGLGARSNAAGVAFKGTFDGEGHTIYNLNSRAFYDGIQYGEFTNLLSKEDDQTETGWYINVKNDYLGNNVDVDVALQLKDNSADASDKRDEFSFGLFGTVYNATIKNLNLEEVHIDIPEKTVNKGEADEKTCIGDSAGTIVGFAQYNLTLENCRVGYEGCTGTITGAKCAGGLVGRFYGGKDGDGKDQYVEGVKNYSLEHYGSVTIKDCVNYLNVGIAGIDKKAGIIGYPGYFSSVNIENCTNYGKILGIYAGGIVGYGGNGTNPCHGSMTVENCNNYGEINGSYAGGILAIRGTMGNNSKVIPFFIFRNCNNYGNIMGIPYAPSGIVRAGGLVGDMNISTASGVVLDCFNYGNITVENSTAIKQVYAGGLFGYFAIDNKAPVFVISGGSCGNVNVTRPEGLTGGAGICFGITPDSSKLSQPYGSVIAVGTASITAPATDDAE